MYVFYGQPTMSGWRGYRAAARLLCIALGLTGFAALPAAATETGPLRIVASYPHDAGAFTQGLTVRDGELYESTGRYGHSSLRRVDPESGRIRQSRALADRYFGEGLAVVGDRIYQLTWKAGVVFVYDRYSFRRIARLSYAGEGWGLTWDGHALIMSDGSAVLRFLDPTDFSVRRRITVRRGGQAVDQLNELEYIDGEIWANVWESDRIVRIDPARGHVIDTIDASNLRAALPRPAHANVLNGIAWDAEHRRLYLTGKDWPRLFEVAWPPRGDAQ